MAALDADFIKALPKWVFVVAFSIFVVFMVTSPFFGTFKLFGYEFGYSRKSADKPVSSVEPMTTEYTVGGHVQKSDGQEPSDVTIWIGFPPFAPTGSGEIIGVNVWKGPNGKFPNVAFTHGDYGSEAIDLNDEGRVLRDGNTLTIRQPVVMRPVPKQKGTCP